MVFRSINSGSQQLSTAAASTIPADCSGVDIVFSKGALSHNRHHSDETRGCNKPVAALMNRRVAINLATLRREWAVLSGHSDTFQIDTMQCNALIHLPY